MNRALAAGTLSLLVVLLMTSPSGAPPLPPPPVPQITYTPVYRLPLIPRRYGGDWTIDFNNMVRTLETEIVTAQTQQNLEPRVSALESRATTLEVGLAQRSFLGHTHEVSTIPGFQPAVRASLSATLPVRYDVLSGVISLLPSDIDHDSLAGYVASQHRPLNDALTGENNLWSASKVNAEIAARAGGMIDDLGTTEIRTWSSSKIWSVVNAAASGGHTHTSTQITDFTEAARSVLSAGSGLTYAPTTGVLSVNPSAISHDALANYVANQHREMDDTDTDPVKVWSSAKTNAEIQAKANVGHRHAPEDVDGLNFVRGTLVSVPSGALTPVWSTSIQDVQATRYTVTLTAALADGSSLVTGRWVFTVGKRSGSNAGVSLPVQTDNAVGYTYNPDGKLVSGLVISPAISGGTTLILRAQATTSGSADPGSYTLAYQVESLGL